jgi:hypothetical protein
MHLGLIRPKASQLQDGPWPNQANAAQAAGRVGGVTARSPRSAATRWRRSRGFGGRSARATEPRHGRAALDRVGASGFGTERRKRTRGPARGKEKWAGLNKQ